MATQVSFSELSAWLSSQPDNTPSTPYELTITDIPHQQYAVKTILNANPTKYVDLSTTEQATGLPYDYSQCKTLVKAPIFLTAAPGLTACFLGCINLIEVPPLPSSTPSMSGCFSGCTSLTTIPNIPSSVTGMNDCFRNCTSLTNVPDIPNTVTNMDNCFSKCTSLVTAPVISNSVTTMQQCFDGCTSLTTVQSLSTSLTNMNRCFQGCTALVTVPNIPNTVLDMQWCFYNCTSLVTAPALSTSVTNVEGCFYNCTSLTTAPSLPNSITNLQSCFQRCVALTTAPQIPNSITNMESCFFNCRALTTAPTIPDSVTILSSCFSFCSSLITAPAIPNSVTTMNSCFAYCTALTNVPDIPDSVTEMRYCFVECRALTSVNIESNANVDMHTCFSDCTSLTTVTHLPSNTTNLGSCFSGCSQLTSVSNIPNKNTSLKQTFSNCTSLTTVTFEDKADNVTDAENCFYGCTSLQTIQNLPTSITDIATYKIPASVTYISFGTGANNIQVLANKFYSMTNLTTAINVPVIANMRNIFYVHPHLETVSFRQTDTVLNIDMSSSFERCTTLTNVQNLPRSVANMYKCFMGCTSLTTVPRFPQDVTNMESCFDGCTALTTVPDLPDTVTNMESCFKECRAMTAALPIPKSAANLKLCFQSCTSLTTTPYIPDSVNNMESCFRGCNSIETVTNLPNSITNLKTCFQNCTSLTTINDFQVSKDTLENNAQNCFYNCSALTKIVVRYNETTDWHVFRLDFGSTDVSGKVYDKNGTAVAIPTTTITKSKLVMPVLSDELLFTDTISDADLDDLIADILEYKYTYTTKDAIDPTKKSLVLWADNPDNVITNLSFPADVSHASGVLPIANGGTGRTTAPNIQVNLASNSSVSELPASGDVAPGVTGTLPIANGGIGRTTAPNIQVNLASNSSVSELPASGNVAPGVTGTLPVANGGTGQTDLNNVTVGKALNGVWGRLGGARQSSKSTFTALITEELTGSNFGGGICGGSINTSAADKGIPAGWYNYLYVPHRTGIGGGNNYKFGTLYVSPMTSNSDTLYVIHYTSGTVNNAKIFKSDGTGIATAVKDSGNGTSTTFAYSKEGLTGNPNWLAAWNGYELRAIAPSQVTSGSSSNLNGTMQQATHYWTQLDLSTLDASKWFPVTFALGTTGFTEVECYVSLDSGTKPSWSTHSSGFSCHLHLLVMGSGWGTTQAQTLVLDRGYSFANINPVGWTQMGHSSTGVLWLRGGGKYRVWNNKGAGYTIRTSTYTVNEESVSPTTSYQWSFSYAQLVGTISNANFASQADISRGTALCDTDGSVKAKVASMRGFTFANGQIFPISFTKSNTYNGAITLNINGTGAKTVYINNAVSSSTNKTLPAGTYLCVADGGYYKIETSWGAPFAKRAQYASSSGSSDSATRAYFLVELGNDYMVNTQSGTTKATNFNGIVPVRSQYFTARSGYIVYMNGLCIQWVSGYDGSEHNTTLKFPLAFANTDYIAFPTRITVQDDGNSVTWKWLGVHSKLSDKQSFTCRTRTSGSGDRWVGIGWV